MSTSRDTSAAVAYLVLAAFAPVAVGAAALVAGASVLRAVLLAVGVPLAVSALAGLSLVGVALAGRARHPRSRAVSPELAPAPARAAQPRPAVDLPGPRAALPVEHLAEAEAVLRERERCLVQAARRTPAAPYDELLALADEVRVAALARTQALVAVGGTGSPPLPRLEA